MSPWPMMRAASRPPRALRPETPPFHYRRLLSTFPPESAPAGAACPSASAQTSRSKGSGRLSQSCSAQERKGLGKHALVVVEVASKWRGHVVVGGERAAGGRWPPVQVPGRARRVESATGAPAAPVDAAPHGFQVAHGVGWKVPLPVRGVGKLRREGGGGRGAGPAVRLAAPGGRW